MEGRSNSEWIKYLYGLHHISKQPNHVSKNYHYLCSLKPLRHKQMTLDVSNFGYRETIDTTLNHTFFQFFVEKTLEKDMNRFTKFVSLGTKSLSLGCKVAVREGKIIIAIFSSKSWKNCQIWIVYVLKFSNNPWV